MSSSRFRAAMQRLLEFLRDTGLDRLLLLAVCVCGWIFLVHRTDPSHVRRADEIRFVQITDAHLFDAGKDQIGSDKCLGRLDNLAALQWAIAQTNAMQEQSMISGGPPKVDFLVFTGDFGLDNVIDKTPQPNPDWPKTPPCDAGNTLKIPVAPVTMEEAASEVADVFSGLKGGIPILLVPGNNDLTNELPSDLPRYKNLVGLLQARLPGRILDLSEHPTEVSGLSILGLNTASFKPTMAEKSNFPNASFSQSPLLRCRISTRGGERVDSPLNPPVELGTEPTEAELFAKSDDASVRGRGDALCALKKDADIAKSKGDYIVFTHIPDTPDPATDCNNEPDLKPATPAKISGMTFRFRSAWFLSAEQRKTWNKIVSDPNLVAVFAGHFHKPDRDLYGKLTGPEKLPTGPPPRELTYVAPPLAIKFQTGKNPMARGLMLVDMTFQSRHWQVAQGDRRPDDPTGVVGKPYLIWYGSPIISAAPRPFSGLAPVATLIVLCFISLAVSPSAVILAGYRKSQFPPPPPPVNWILVLAIFAVPILLALLVLFVLSKKLG